MENKPTENLRGQLVNLIADEEFTRSFDRPIKKIHDRLSHVFDLMSRIDRPTTSGAYLLVINNHEADSWYTLDDDKPSVIGRSEIADIDIRCQSASRQHCVIEKIDSNWLITDNQSKNGTIVNDQKINKKYLCDGDIIMVTEMELVFTIVDNGDSTDI